ncbi:hypothetical protein NSA56_10100 [Oceanobacillus caeni]|uniref:Uncharacterized protein n=1 Tax=Oceanobacillus caeni TaxID=405946 RepID=A0ABR5MKX8_9BACI|nr:MULTISPECIES: hypothetical protein [Bacillaceae]KKE80039.1 hypothetical protein WH51_03720 [Bacilli bacterium VT-13-104]PZD86439.1 hypothetical protein DEJ64_07640 [Bacilli bacterium]KPH76550.1 hypothetical protein AFL42_05545 [Oceanobacillus caeni]MBU8791524.1 hypothetical protein [Oceanobacillus caeni]MCR1834750.1 hypothetical protein [Oceanobacillus caeni]
MSNYEDFIKEKQVIDELVKQNYVIKNIQGTLEGDVVKFEKLGNTAARKSIRLTNPDSRKYVTTLLIKGK